MSDQNELKLFTGNAHPELAQKVAERLGIELGRLTVSRFSDGEIRVKIEESIRGCDVFILQPTCAPVNESLMELLVLQDAFKRASAHRVVPVIPYYGYARQDKKLKPREPITAKLIADLIMTAGADRIFALDLHAGQIQGFFNAPVDHLHAAPLLARYYVESGLKASETVVVSPDVGGVERATIFSEYLGSGLAIIAKRRPAPNQCEVTEFIGDVNHKTAILVDDLIDTGGSALQAAGLLAERGASRILACCTHPVLSGDALRKLDASPLEEIVVTDTIPIPQQKRIPKLKILSVAPILADAIRRIHCHQSVSTLFETNSQ
ncbi:MAG: ribose-phosphate pyrophosphokinase [Armatimonadetes bacterium]|nr:ribose-phosphate pyrophosphokinase [Armatimonadota bacterium]